MISGDGESREYLCHITVELDGEMKVVAKSEREAREIAEVTWDLDKLDMSDFSATVFQIKKNGG